MKLQGGGRPQKKKQGTKGNLGRVIYLFVCFHLFCKECWVSNPGPFHAKQVLYHRAIPLAPKKIIWRMFLLGLCADLYKVRSKSNVYWRSNVLRYSILKSNNRGLSMILQMTQGSGAISLECRKRTSYIRMNILLRRQGNLWQWEPEPRTRCIY